MTNKEDAKINFERYELRLTHYIDADGKRVNIDEPYVVTFATTAENPIPLNHVLESMYRKLREYVITGDDKND